MFFNKKESETRQIAFNRKKVCNARQLKIFSAERRERSVCWGGEDCSHYSPILRMSFWENGIFSSKEQGVLLSACHPIIHQNEMGNCSVENCFKLNLLKPTCVTQLVGVVNSKGSFRWFCCKAALEVRRWEHFWGTFRNSWDELI